MARTGGVKREVQGRIRKWQNMREEDKIAFLTSRTNYKTKKGSKQQWKDVSRKTRRGDR